MPTTLRDLLPRVMMYRPELDDAKGMFCLIEAMRQLTQNAAILRDELAVPVNMEDRATNFPTYMPAGQTLYRAEGVRHLKMPDDARFAGYWDAKNNVPDLYAINMDPVPFDRWITMANLPIGRTYAAGIFLGNGRFAVLGGGDPNGVANPNTYLQFFDANTNTWGTTTTLETTSPARFSTLTTLSSGRRKFEINNNGKILLCGGIANTGDTAREKATFILDTQTLAVTQGPSSPYVIGNEVHQTKMPDGSVYMWIAEDLGFQRKAFLQYIWQSNTLRARAISDQSLGSFAQSETVVVRCSDTKILVNMANRLNWAVYNTDTNTWDATPINTGSVDRAGILTTGIAACYMTGNQALLAGGITDASRAIQIIDSAARTITTVATLPSITRIGAINKIGSTRYLLVGNASDGTSTAKAYIFDVSDASIKDITDFNPTDLDLFETPGVCSDGKNVYMFGGRRFAAPYGDGLGTRVFQPAQSEYSRNGYWIVNTYGTTELGEHNHWEVNDVAFLNGTTNTWDRFSEKHFTTMIQSNEPLLSQYTGERSLLGGAYTWTQTNGDIYTYYRSESQDVLKVNYSYSFSGNEQNVIEVPNEVEQIVVDGALGKLMLVPGVNANAGLATAYDMKFKKGIATMRAIGMFGYGGNPTYVVGGAFGPQWNTLAVNWMEK